MVIMKKKNPSEKDEVTEIQNYTRRILVLSLLTIYIVFLAGKMVEHQNENQPRHVLDMKNHCVSLRSLDPPCRF